MMIITGVILPVQSDNRQVMVFVRILMLVVFCMSAWGCAASSTTIVDSESVTNPKPLFLYTSLIISDFVLDKEMITDAPDTRMSEREQRYSRLPDELSNHLVRYITSHRIYRSVTRDGTPNATTLVLKGKFTRVGRFRISLAATLHDGETGQEVASFRETLWDVLDATETVTDLAKTLADFIDRIHYK